MQAGVVRTILKVLGVAPAAATTNTHTHTRPAHTHSVSYLPCMRQLQLPAAATCSQTSKAATNMASNRKQVPPPCEHLSSCPVTMHHLADSRCGVTPSKSLVSHPACHWRRGDVSLLLVVLVMLSVKLSCWLSSSSVLRRALPLDCARGGRRSLPLRKSAPDPDAPLQCRKTNIALWQQ